MYNAGSSEVIPVHAVKAGGGLEIQLSALLSLAIDGMRGQLHAPTTSYLGKVFPIQIE